MIVLIYSVNRIRFLNVKSTMQSRAKPYLITIHCSFLYCQIQFADFLFKIFASMTMRDIALKFSFIVMFSQVWSLGYYVRLMRQKLFLLLLFFERVNVRLLLFLKCLIEFTSESIWTHSFLYRKFYFFNLKMQFPLYVGSYLGFLFHLVSVLVSCIVQKIYPLHVSCIF